MAQSPLWISDRLRILFSRIKERLWVKPLVLCVLSVGGAFIAKLADDTGLSGVLPEIKLESVESFSIGRSRGRICAGLGVLKGTGQSFFSIALIDWPPRLPGWFRRLRLTVFR